MMQCCLDVGLATGKLRGFQGFLVAPKLQNLAVGSGCVDLSFGTATVRHSIRIIWNGTMTYHDSNGVNRNAVTRSSKIWHSDSLRVSPEAVPPVATIRSPLPEHRCGGFMGSTCGLESYWSILQSWDPHVHWWLFNGWFSSRNNHHNWSRLPVNLVTREAVHQRTQELPFPNLVHDHMEVPPRQVPDIGSYQDFGEAPAQVTRWKQVYLQ